MKDNRNLRFIFVQLLFSLAIGQVAMKISDLVIEGHSLYTSHFIYFHLLLCVVVLATSWVGFQISTHTQDPLNSVFSLQFIILLIDIALVITYFIIVRGAEIGNYPKDGKITVLLPNTHNETFWSMAIFGIYLIWDCVTKLPSYSLVKANGSYVKITSLDFKKFANRMWPTATCFLLSIALFLSINHDNVTPIKATAVDIVLICLFLIFRGLKQEVKITYKYREDQLTESMKKNIEPGSEYPIEIQEKRYPLKKFVIFYLPIILFVLSLIFLIKVSC